MAATGAVAGWQSVAWIRAPRTIRGMSAPRWADRRSIEGKPPLEVVRGKHGKLRINDGVTRATRAAKLLPGQEIPAEVIQTLPKLDGTRLATIKDVLP